VHPYRTKCATKRGKKKKKLGNYQGKKTEWPINCLGGTARAMREGDNLRNTKYRKKKGSNVGRARKGGKTSD